MPPPRKHPSARQNTITKDIYVVPRQEPAVVPAAPRGLQPIAKESWRAFWLSPISQLVDHDSDMPALRRWSYCVSERARLAPILKKTPLVKGSMGQLVANPLAGLIRDLSLEIRSYEQQFGMTPAARLKLGVVLGQANDALSELMRSLDGDEKTETFDLAEFDDPIEVTT